MWEDSETVRKKKVIQMIIRGWCKSVADKKIGTVTEQDKHRIQVTFNFGEGNGILMSLECLQCGCKWSSTITMREFETILRLAESG